MNRPDDALNQDIGYYRQLLNEHKKRLRVLELQLARFGNSYVPAHIPLDIEETQRKIEEIDQKIFLLETSTYESEDHKKLVQKELAEAQTDLSDKLHKLQGKIDHIQIYRIADPDFIINEVWEALRTLYTDIANVHFKSAQSAFVAARNSNKPEMEMRIAIGHLTSAFHTYQELLTKTRQRTRLLLFSEKIPLLDYKETQQVKKCLFEISSYITISYGQLGEMANAKIWKTKAADYLQDYVNEATDHLTGKYIHEHIDKNYVEVRDTIQTEYWGRQISNKKVTEYRLTEAGMEYVRQQKEEIQKIARDLFESLQIE